VTHGDHSTDESGKAGAGDKLRVLVIDDDDIAREMLCETLRNSGHEVHELSSAIGATRAIAQNKIEAVVLDVIMPSINGDKLARLLREAARGDRLAIVLVSGRPMDELVGLAAAARADAVLPKSEVRKNLGRTLHRAYRERTDALERRASNPARTRRTT
jgi:CheY-like chemotaxis protein